MVSVTKLTEGAISTSEQASDIYAKGNRSKDEIQENQILNPQKGMYKIESQKTRNPTHVQQIS